MDTARSKRHPNEGYTFGFGSRRISDCEKGAVSTSSIALRVGKVWFDREELRCHPKSTKLNTWMPLATVSRSNFLVNSISFTSNTALHQSVVLQSGMTSLAL